MFDIKYLPAAKRDLSDIALYISDTLMSPAAALRFIDAVEKAEESIRKNPSACHKYQCPAKLKYEYRVKHVKNYSMFYTENNGAIEIHRILYSKMDIAKKLK